MTYFITGAQSEYGKVIFPNQPVTLRTNEHYKNAIAYANEKNIIFGIKKSNIITQSMNVPFASKIDYMHLLCCGIFVMLLNKWFTKSKGGGDYYIGNYLTF